MDGSVLLDRARTGWRWWIGELAQMVPQRLRDALSATDDAVVIEMRDDELVVARRSGKTETVAARIPRDPLAARALGAAAPHKSGLFDDPVILQLPATGVLRRQLRLPRAARRNLPGILRHEVVRQSPLGAEAIYYDYRVAGDDGQAIDVDLRIVRRDAVDSGVEFCRGAGVPLAAVAFAGDVQSADGGTLPADPVAARWLRLRPRIVPALAALAVVLAFAFTGSLYLRGAAMADDLDSQVEAAQSRAAVVDRLEDRLDAANRQAAFLAAQKKNPAAVAVLADVARLLPDNTWLYEFELNGDEVRLHGFSSQAAALIALFDSAPDFADAQFRSPLMQGPSSALQRFDVSFRLKKKDAS